MRSMLRIMFLALVTVFALAAIAASSALAAPEWYAKKSGVWAKVTTPVKIKIEGTVEVNDREGYPSLKRPLAISCHFTEALNEGEVKPAGAGKIELHLGSAECKPATVENNTCQAIEGKASTNLPWATELYSEGSELRQRLVNGGAGTPIWTFKCKTFFNPIEDNCSFNTSMHTTNLVSGLVEAALDTKSNQTYCSSSNKTDGEWKGSLKFKANQTGVEAIKVE